MKILYVDVNYKGSSTGDIVFNLHKQCIEKGMESKVCYGRGKKQRSDKNIYKFGLDFETYLHAFLTRFTGYTGFFSFFSTKRLINFIKKYNPDVIHIHELHAYFVNVFKFLKFLKLSGKKVVFTNHCDFLFTGKCGLSKECTRYSEKCGKCPHLREYPKSLFFDHTAFMIDKKKKIFENWNNCVFVSPSNWHKKKTKLSFLKNKRSLVIHNGIEIKWLKCNDNHPNKQKKTILSIAPDIMSDNKGGYRVIEIAKRFIDKNVEFILVGLKGKMPKNIPNNVKIHPLIKDKKTIYEFYQTSDLLLICSSQENYPTISLEAQCFGLPILGFDVGGVSETILEGQGGLVAYQDYDALEALIEEYLNIDIDKKSISIKSKIAFSSEKMFEEYYKLYLEND